MTATPPRRAPDGGGNWWLRSGAVVVFGLILIAVALDRLGNPDGGEEPTALPILPADQVAATPLAPAASPVVPAAAAVGAPDGRRVVCLDPGHGGKDEGHIRQQADGSQLMEKDLTLEVGRLLEQRLPARGIEVVMTRRDDTVVNASGEDINGDGITAAPGKTSQEMDDLLARVNICNAAATDLLVSIHFNGADNPDLEGYEVFYNSDRPFSDRSERFAELVYEELGEQMGAVGYVANPHGIGVEDHVVTGPISGSRTAESRMPGALVEGLYLSNDEDAAFVLSDGALFAIALAYEEAIARYFEEYPG